MKLTVVSIVCRWVCKRHCCVLCVVFVVSPRVLLVLLGCLSVLLDSYLWKYTYDMIQQAVRCYILRWFFFCRVVERDTRGYNLMRLWYMHELHERTKQAQQPAQKQPNKQVIRMFIINTVLSYHIAIMQGPCKSKQNTVYISKEHA